MGAKRYQTGDGSHTAGFYIREVGAQHLLSHIGARRRSHHTHASVAAANNRR